MTDILLFGSLGALGGILFSCLASGIYAAWHNWRVRRRNRLEMARRLRQPGWAFLPPAMPTRSAGSYQPPSAILPPPLPPRNDAH